MWQISALHTLLAHHKDMKIELGYQSFKEIWKEKMNVTYCWVYQPCECHRFKLVGGRLQNLQKGPQRRERQCQKMFLRDLAKQGLLTVRLRSVSILWGKICYCWARLGSCQETVSSLTKCKSSYFSQFTGTVRNEVMTKPYNRHSQTHC